MRRATNERGAAAVEFALVAPLLIALVLGIAVFGRAYQVQSSLSMAAREGVRVMAIENDPSMAQSRAESAAADLGVSGVTAASAECSGSPESTTMTVSYTFSFLGVTIPMSGRAVMRCGG